MGLSDDAATFSPLLRQAGVSASAAMERPDRRMSNSAWPLVSEPDSGAAQKLAFGQHPVKGRRKLRQSSTLWMPEILSCLFSLCCVLAIVAVLKVHEGKPNPTWPIGLTLNAVVALLASMAKLGFIYPIVSGLGQLRWSWFVNNNRPLADFEVFDQACRGGVLGGLKLLFTFKGGPLGVLGGLLIVISLVTSPITQQVIDYSSLVSPINGTALSRRMVQTGPNSLLDPQRLLRMKRDSIAAAYFFNETVEDIAPSCPSGECTFPTFRSLGMCAKVANVSRHLVVARSQDINWTFPIAETEAWSATLPAVNLSLVAPNMNSFGMWFPNTTSMSFAGTAEAKAALLDFYMIYSNPSHSANANISFEAVEILFHACVKEFSVGVKDGKPSTTGREIPLVVGSDTLTSGSMSVQWNPRVWECLDGLGQFLCNGVQWGHLELRVGDDTGAGRSQGETFQVDEMPGMLVSMTLASMIGNAPIVGGQFLGMLGSRNMRVFQWFGDISWPIGLVMWTTELGLSQPPEQFIFLQHTMNNLAKSVDNLFRDLGPDSASVQGIVWGPLAHVSVRWGWLGFLLAELALALAFLAGSVVATARARLQVIKGSSLATMVALTDQSIRMRLGGIDDLDGLEERAGKVTVRMERGVSGVGLGLGLKSQEVSA